MSLGRVGEGSITGDLAHQQIVLVDADSRVGRMGVQKGPGRSAGPVLPGAEDVTATIGRGGLTHEQQSVSDHFNVWGEAESLARGLVEA
jgi:hypothetical protein